MLVPHFVVTPLGLLNALAEYVRQPGAVTDKTVLWLLKQAIWSVMGLTSVHKPNGKTPCGKSHSG